MPTGGSALLDRGDQRPEHHRRDGGRKPGGRAARAACDSIARPPRGPVLARTQSQVTSSHKTPGLVC